jgi:putative amide transporter protein
VGSVLFLNGLLFLGKADAKGVAVFNLFVGRLQTAIPFCLIATARTGE